MSGHTELKWTPHTKTFLEAAAHAAVRLDKLDYRAICTAVEDTLSTARRLLTLEDAGFSGETWADRRLELVQQLYDLRQLLSQAGISAGRPWFGSEKRIRAAYALRDLIRLPEAPPGRYEEDRNEDNGDLIYRRVQDAPPCGIEVEALVVLLVETAELLREAMAGETPPALVQSVAATQSQTGGENVFQLDGRTWRVCYRDGDESGSFADRENSVERRLVRLLAEPNRRFRALEFWPPPPGAAAIPHMGRDENSDGTALNEEEKRLTQLVNEIKEAEAARDTESANKLRDEFEKLTEHVDGEKKARKRGHKKRCGSLSATGRADQALRVGLERLKNRFRENGLPKLADHLDKYINNSEGDWWYAPSPGTSQWNVTLPRNTFQK